MKRVDLHVHSSYSDGTFTPVQLVDYAISKGLAAFALTDHDTTDGIAEAVSYAADKSIEIIPGIELSTDYNGKDVHILGLFIDPLRPEFRKHLVFFQESRITRNRKMCENLRALLIDITYEKLQEEFPSSVITRAHYARFLLNHGYVKNMAEAFERYVGDHCPSYVPREKITPSQAVKLILSAGGVPILAHPILYHLPDAELDSLVAGLVDNGLMGIEAVYSSYALCEEHAIKRLAAKYHLLLSGGSDFHGSNKPGLDLADGYGKLFVPDELLTNIRTSHNQQAAYLVSLDMDGTLLNDDKKVTPLTKAALDDYIKAGNRLVISTGRPLASLFQLIKDNDLSYPGLILSAFNGGLLYDCDTKTILMQKTISKECVKCARDLAANENLHFHAYTLNEIVSERETNELHYYCSYVKLPFTITNDLTAPEFPEPFKVFSIDLIDHAKLELLRQNILKTCSDSLQCVFSESIFLEILPKNSGKGPALSFLTTYLSIPREHTYAFGDAENDITMLAYAGHGIALKNASPSVLAMADEVTLTDNNHDGITPYLKKLTHLE